MKQSLHRMLDIFSWVVSPGGQGAKAPQKDADGFHEPQDDEQTRPNSVFSFGKFRTWSGRSLSKLQEIPRELVRWNILDILPKNEPSSDGCVSMRFPASSKPSDTAGWNTSQSGLSYRNLQDRSVLGDLFDIAASYVRTMPQVSCSWVQTLPD